MAEIKLVGWVLSPIIKKLADMAFSYSESQYNRQNDMRKNFKKLADILTEIQTVVAIAEHLQSMDASHEQMLRRLKDAIYEADNLLDEFGYQIKEAQAMEGGGTVSRVVSSSCKLARRLIAPDKLANRLKEILPELDSIRQSANTFSVQVVGFERHNAIQQSKIVHDRITSSIPPTLEIFGRAKEKEAVIDLLLKRVDEPGSSHTNVPVIAIVGDGGIGKTTLAQHVYADKRINDKFYMKWICVPKNFDEIMLTREILECISNGRNKYITNFNDLQIELQAKIQSKRFLLVLDDVWIKEDNKAGSNVAFFNQKKWEMLLAPLKDGKKGSMILVTTRMKIVANVFGATSFTLKGLPDNETWLLLKRYAFGNEIPYNSSELEKIGQQNIKRLDGSPLAAKVVGSLLKDKPDAKSWSEILARRIYYDIMPILELSYQFLPDHLRYCFAFCSIFPKNWKFEPKNLVLLWIAQGYVLPDGTERSLRDIGMDYFNQLLSRSLFEKTEQHYVMHDLINDLAQFVSKDECFRIDGGKQGEISETVKHLGVVANYENELRDIFTQLGKMSNLKNLRTLILFGFARFSRVDLPFGILKELKSLRVLDFGISLASQFPKTLYHCLYLRYLNLGPTFFGILPKSLSKLYHLQVLSAGQLLLSQNMFRLLKFGEPKFLAIQRLEFKVEKKRCHGIGVLKNMGMEIGAVQGNLCIMNLENVTDKAEVAEADLGSKQYLDGLELHWDSSSARINGHDADQEVAQALKPHPNLELLTIKGFLGKRCPSWLESKWLGNLRSLSLIDCSELEVLPPLDHLPLLKKCRVEKCPKLMSFPRFPPMLEQIYITETGLISELYLRPLSSSECFQVGTTGTSSHATLLHDHHLWAIRELRIEDCKEPLPVKWLLRLTALEKLQIIRCQEWLMSEEEEDRGGILHSSLEYLDISYCPVTERWLSRCLRGLTSLKKLMVCHSPELKSLPQEDGGVVLATSLESLHISKCPVTDVSLIYHCRSLKDLCLLDCPVTDPSLISHCPSLVHLTVQNCPGLKSLSEEDGSGVLATSLESLNISGCPVTDLSLISHCTSLKYLTVQNCPGLKSLSEEDGSGVLATSLESLYISGCPVTDLSLISHFTSLKYMIIEDCPELKSLPEEGLPTSIERVRFVGCGAPKESVVRCLQGLPSLSRLRVDFWTHFTAFTSLHHLEIVSCRCEPNSTVELPESLQILEIFDCDVSVTFLSTCLQGLTSLSELSIRGCNELTSLPSAHVLDRLTALQDLTLNFWTNLTAFTRLRYLKIDSCRCEPNSTVALPESLQTLHFWNCDVSDTLLSTCLQGLTSLSHLRIARCNELTFLPSAQVLHRLTALQILDISGCDELTSLGALHALASLKHLIVQDCRKLESLPKEGLPSSIVSLALYNCHPALQQQLREKKGPDWDKMTHIPDLYVH